MFYWVYNTRDMMVKEKERRNGRERKFKVAYHTYQIKPQTILLVA